MIKILFFLFQIVFYIQYIVLGWLLRIIFYKTKSYYEDDTKQNKYFKGGAVVISNHHSFWDGLALTTRYFFKRWHFISEDFFSGKLEIVKFIVRACGGIFIESKISDFDFIEESKKIFNKGRPVIIFPEGGFQRTYEPSKFYTGYVLLAVKTGTKIVPVVNDFNYGIFKRVHFLIGNSIDLSGYSDTELTREKRNEINKIVYEKFIMLFYLLKKKKAEKFSFKYELFSPKSGAVIRIKTGSGFHYGIYLNDGEVIQFGHAVNKPDEEVTVNSVSLKEFCGETEAGGGLPAPEVRIIKKRFLRKLNDIEKYARSCLGQKRYDAEKNNCLDFVNRVTLKI